MPEVQEGVEDGEGGGRSPLCVRAVHSREAVGGGNSNDAIAMLKRPLNKRFNQAVLDGRKFTTIREKPWPVGVHIMLYNWSGSPYRSKQVDVAPVKVLGYWPITIAKAENGAMSYDYGLETEIPLWQHEGFMSPEELDEWFGEMVKPGQTITLTLMRFRLLNVPDHRQPEQTQTTEQVQ